MGHLDAVADSSGQSSVAFEPRRELVWMARRNRKQRNRGACFQSAQKTGRHVNQNRAQYRIRNGENVMSPSIRRRLVLLVLASIVLIWGVALVSSYRQAKHEIGEWEEARLAELAQIL